MRFAITKLESRIGTARISEREHEGHHRVGLQSALHGDRGEHVAEQVGPGIAEEDRGRVEAVAQVAERRAGGQHREHPGRVAVEREREHGKRQRRDRAHARGEPVDAVDEVHDVHHRDDPDHGQRVGEVAEVEVPRERERHRLDPHAGGDRHDRGQHLARELDVRRQVEQVVRDARRPRSPWRRSGCRSSAGPWAGTRGRTRARRPGSRGRRGARSASGAGRASAARRSRRCARPAPSPRAWRSRPPPGPGRRLGVRREGQASSVTQLRSSQFAGRCLLHVAVVPQREHQEAPDLAAQVLLSRYVAVEQPGDDLRLEETLCSHVVRATGLRGRRVPGRRAATRRPGSRSPACGPAGSPAGRRPATASRSRRFFASRRTFIERGRASASSATSGSQNGTRASSECAMLARSVFTSRSSAR